MSLSTLADVCFRDIDLISQSAENEITAFQVYPCTIDNFHPPSMHLQKNSPTNAKQLKKLFQSSPSSEVEHSTLLRQVIGYDIDLLNSLERQAYITDRVKTEVFIAVQRFNHQVRLACNPIKCTFVPLFTKLRLFKPIQPESCSEVASLEVLPYAITETKLANIPPEQEVFITKKGGCKKEILFHYNRAELAAHHSTENIRIFLATQWERFWSMIGRVNQYMLLNVFGKRCSCLPQYHYFRHNENLNTDIYAHDTPFLATSKTTSHWIGHSTCLISVPIHTPGGESVSVTIVTDPVEGDLMKLFYPRMTAPSRPIASIPVPHIFLLSHNHMDHYQESTVRKLTSYQPIMLVPRGMKENLVKLGFLHVYEQDWWTTTTIPFSQDGKKLSIRITSVCARHTSSMGIGTTNRSLFLGYVINTGRDDLYFPGDTARLTEEHIQTLRERFRLRGMWQPGGPDDRRVDLQSSHQSSADGLLMHFELLVRSLYTQENGHLMPKEAFLQLARGVRTLFMHTKTYKLGNLHFDDTDESVRRVKEALLSSLSNCEVRPYERQVAEELCLLGRQLTFADGRYIEPRDITDLLQAGVIVPKIGSTHEMTA